MFRYFQEFKRVLSLEKAISEARVFYVLSGADEVPTEYEILKDRGFNPSLLSSLERAQIDDYSIVMLDLVNSDMDEEQSKKISDRLPEEAFLVVYFNTFSRVIEALKKEVKYFNVANNRIALMGAVINAAHVARALNLKE